MGAFESIGTVTATSYVASMTVSSIPSTYKHLYIRLTSRTYYLGGSTNIGGYLQPNSNSSAQYYSSTLQVFSSNASTSFNVLNGFAMTSSGDASSFNNLFSATECWILDYTSTTKYKQGYSKYGQITYAISPSGTIANTFTEWQNLDAITSIRAIPNIGSFYPDSKLEVYGFSGS